VDGIASGVALAAVVVAAFTLIGLGAGATGAGRSTVDFIATVLARAVLAAAGFVEVGTGAAGGLGNIS